MYEAPVPGGLVVTPYPAHQPEVFRLRLELINQLVEFFYIRGITLAVAIQVVHQAIAIWAASGLSDLQMQRLDQTRAQIADLPVARLGEALGTTITVDIDAAGHGWFIGTAAGNYHKPGRPIDQPSTTAEMALVHKMDLLTVVLHELGHVLGLPDDYADIESADLMNGWLASGVRRLPTEADLTLLAGDSRSSALKG